MKFLFYATLLLIISQVWCGESEADSDQCITNSLKGNLTTKCDDAFCVGKKIEDYNNCIANNCKKYGCDAVNFPLKDEKYCDAVWGAYCCGTEFFFRECSWRDLKVFEFAIQEEVINIETNFCPKFPRNSFDCKNVHFGQLLNE
jgi:hypothetical protein